MSDLNKKKLAVATTKKSVGVSALLGAFLMMTSNAHAAIDLSKLNEQFTQLETAVSGVIGVALTVLLVVVGWRWVKRAVGGI